MTSDFCTLDIHLQIHTGGKHLLFLGCFDYETGAMIYPEVDLDDE